MWPQRLKSMPAVKTVMSPFPYFVDAAASLEVARDMMAKHGIHHLPVTQRGDLVGVISHRDLVRALDRRQAGEHLLVGDAPREEVFIVDLSEPLDRVLNQMAERRLGAALVAKEGRLAGIFTLTDACRYFAESLRQQFPSGGSDEAA